VIHKVNIRSIKFFAVAAEMASRRNNHINKQSTILNIYFQRARIF
jgi:hypothetical protein